MLIFYKLLLAVIEVMAGILFLLGAFFIEHANVARVISASTNSGQLDSFVNWMFQTLMSFKLEYPIILHIGLLLIAFGAFNVLLAIGVWFKSQKMRRLALVVFGGLALYSIIQLFESFSVFDLMSLILDLILLYYFWRILPKHIAN